MTHKVNVLADAKDDFRAIRTQVKKIFGENVWVKTNQNFKDTIADIGNMPFAGSNPPELASLGFGSFKQRLVGKTRIIYEIEATEVYAHLFVSTDRDFESVLIERMTKTNLI